jgi:hypothetical protein
MNDSLRTLRTFAFIAISALTGAGLTACGGGDNLASGGIVGTGDSGRATQGTITALGTHSIVVNGQSFPLTGVPITVNGQSATDSALVVGMVVTVLTTVHGDGSLTVTGVQYTAEVQGVVTGVDPAAQAFTVLGQRVQTDRLTLFQGGTFDTLLNQVVEVSGFRSTPGDILATLVIVKPAVPPAQAMLQVTGVVGAIDTTVRTFVIGLQLIDYTGVAPSSVPVGLAKNATVRVDGTQPAPVGTLFANAIALVPPTPPDVSTVEIEGLITEFAGPGSFKVNGQLTDARNAAFEDGTIDMLGNGALVEVSGRISGNVLLASTVDIEHATVVQVDGTVQAVDATAGSVTVGGQVVRVTSDTQYLDSSSLAVAGFALASLRIGDRVSILAFQGSNGLIATRLERVNIDTPPPNQPSVLLQGAINNFVSIGNFMVGGQQVNAGAAAFVGGTAAGLANGVAVSIQGTIGNGVLNASTIQFLAVNPGPTAVTVTGAISGFVSPSSFAVAGQRVDASSATFSNGTVSDLTNGRTVSVQGVIQSGALIAQSVSFAQPPVTTTLDIQGQISNFAGLSNFVVAGQRVNASQASISNGSASDLANGRQVEVKGTLQNGVLMATSVQIQDSSEPQEISVQGLVTNFQSVKSFVVAGRKIDASGAHFEGGSASNLANGVKVQVEGTFNGQTVVATHVEFDD